MLGSALRRGLKAVILPCLVAALALLGASAAIAKKHGTNRPWKGHLCGSSVLNSSTGAFVQDLRGQETHLGRVTVQQTGTTIPTGPTTFTLSGTGVGTAANGAQLFVSFTGSGTIDAAGHTQGSTAITITGGTGRFTHASGSATGSFTGSAVNSTICTSWKGTISY